MSESGKHGDRGTTLSSLTDSLSEDVAVVTTELNDCGMFSGHTFDLWSLSTVSQAQALWEGVNNLIGELPLPAELEEVWANSVLTDDTVTLARLASVAISSAFAHALIQYSRDQLKALKESERAAFLPLPTGSHLCALQHLSDASLPGESLSPAI